MSQFLVCATAQDDLCQFLNEAYLVETEPNLVSIFLVPEKGDGEGVVGEGT